MSLEYLVSTHNKFDKTGLTTCVSKVNCYRSLNKQSHVRRIKSDFIPKAGAMDLPSHSGYNAIRMYIVLMLFLCYFSFGC